MVAEDVDGVASLLVELMEEADDPGRVGDNRGCAVRDSCELLRTICAPRDREMELGAKRPLSRLEDMAHELRYRQIWLTLSALWG